MMSEDIEAKLVRDVFENKNNIFLSGSGGTGKSYLLANTIKKIGDEKGLNIALTSTTGVSAVAIGGTTIHRWSGIRLGKELPIVIANRIRKSKECLKRWIETDILIIDEVSMLGLEIFELLDNIARKIRDNNKPFGGIQLILSGDFLQLPPVNDEFIFKSSVWKELNIINYKLTIPRRFPDVNHFELLQRARIGKLLPEDVKNLKNRVNEYIKYIGSGGERRDEIKPTRIYSLKRDVEKHNFDELLKLQGDYITYISTDKISKKNKEVVSKSEEKEYVEYMDTIIPRQLYFKEGAQVMLTYNLDIDMGLVNGSRGVVKSCEKDGVVVLFKNKMSVKITVNPIEFEDGNVKIIRNQIPLILAWAISIHKSQGSSLDYAIVDLGGSIFSAGMAYVALSRVRTISGVLLSNFLANKIYADGEALEFEEGLNVEEGGEGE